MSLTFEHITLGQRVKFGAGESAKNLACEVERLAAKNVMVIAGEPEKPLAEKGRR